MDLPNLDIKDDLKEDLEPSKAICRCCLRKESGMYNVQNFNSYFVDLVGLNVLQSDGLPQWICWECAALLRKAVRFKHRLLRAHDLLCQYLARCAPFPIDVDDEELSKYVFPHLTHASVIVVDTPNFSSTGFCQYDRRPSKGGCDTPWVGPKMEETVKEEIGFSDYEDNITLDEIRSSDKKLTDEMLATLLASDDAIEVPAKKKKRGKKAKTRAKKETKHAAADGIQKLERMSIRKPIELDPTKIRIIELKPEDQIKQREEESRTGVGLPYRCKYCFKGFNFESKLTSHMHKHSPSRGPYKCEVCSMFLPSAYSLGVHSLIHTRRYECVACARRMIDRASILNHYRSAHEGVVKQYSCTMCNKVFHNSKTHRGHMRNNHSGVRPKCEICGKTFINKDSLEEHKQIHEGIKNYECSECGCRFRTRTQVIRHQLRHTSTKEYYCVECDIRFKTPQTLRMHLLRSTKHMDVNSLPLACSRCDKRFETESNLARHVSIQHEGVRAHVCPTCGAALASKSSLNKHMHSVHQNKKPPPRHICDTCGKAFRGKSVLVNHIRTHTGEKPFECKECGRRFSQRTAMKTHFKLVHLKLKRTFKVKPADSVVEIKVDELPKLDSIRPPIEPTRPSLDPWRPQYDPFFRVTAGP